jgi:hypothetical protein
MPLSRGSRAFKAAGAAELIVRRRIAGGDVLYRRAAIGFLALVVSAGTFLAGWFVGRNWRRGEPDVKDAVIQHLIDSGKVSPAPALRGEAAPAVGERHFVFETIDARSDEKVITVGSFWAKGSLEGPPSSGRKGRFWVEAAYDTGTRTWKPRIIAVEAQSETDSSPLRFP